MRSNQNPSGSVNRNGADPSVAAKLPMSHVPVEWLDSGSWRLPSGKALAEFALQAGFLAPLLFRADRLGKGTPDGRSLDTETVAPAQGKTFSKVDGR
jgi:hypothetical protein